MQRALDKCGSIPPNVCVFLKLLIKHIQVGVSIASCFGLILDMRVLPEKLVSEEVINPSICVYAAGDNGHLGHSAEATSEERALSCRPPGHPERLHPRAFILHAS